MTTIFDVTRMLERAQVYYTLEKTLPDAVRVNAVLVGERMEIDVHEDGHIEIARFRGNEDVESGVELLETILKAYGRNTDAAR